MPSLCLPKKQRDAFVRALKEGDITLDRLYNMTSEQRNTIFSHYIGKELAPFVNGKFEQAMISNQKKAIANWIERTTSRKDPVRRDMLKKVERIKNVLTPDEERGFLKDLASQKLGISVSETEAKNILTMKNTIDELRELVPDNAPIRSEERMAYGLALDNFKQYVGGLKTDAEKLAFQERLRPSNYGSNIIDTANTAKSLVATLDNSFLGRQGIKVLLDGKYKIWGNTAVESFKNIGKELVAKHPGFFKNRSDAVMSAIRADIYSRPNAISGKYNAAKNGYGLGLLHEEAFPSSFPERIPVLGRVFKASETAFNGSALRMRADLADAIISSAEKNGIDMLDEAQATSFGKLVTSMTGRGEIGKAATIGRELNALLFSARFLKANFDTITAHQFDRSMTPEAKRAAALSLLRIATSITALLSVAKIIDPDSVDFDPRSTRFGKIKVGNRQFDITGGMVGLVTLGSRIVPTYHNGEWGFWTKSPSTGKYTKMSEGAFGEQTALDTFENFFEGKLSPGAGAVRDIWKGQNFQGDKPDFVNTTLGLIVPISAEMLIDELKKGNDDVVLAMLAETFGLGSSTVNVGGFGKRWQELKEKKGDKTYNDTIKQVTEGFNEKSSRLESSARWKKMDNEQRTKELDRIRSEETERALKRYGL